MLQRLWSAASRAAPRSFSTSLKVAAPLHVVFASELLPHPEKAAKGGEDALFVEPSLLAFGVADGVGGWADAGVDPAEYARGIMREAHVTSKAVLPKPEAALPQSSHSLAMAILQRAWECTHAPGSSTALVAFIRPVERELTVANLGDSGVMVLRPDGPQYVVAFRTKEQQHAFNFPFQLSSLETHRQHPNTQHDQPSQADVSTFYLRPRDIVVAATDGVFDNVFEDDIAQMATQHCSSTKDSQACANALAKAIVRMAQDVGKSPTALAPFGLNALKSMRQLYKGGKLDDATTVVAVVSDAKPASKL